MAKARKIPGIGAQTRFGDVAAATVEVRTAEVFERMDDVLDTDDIERVHDMRVATRRLRAALEVFAVCFPQKEHKRLLREVKQLADALGERRDPDVAIAWLEGVTGKLGEAAQPGAEGLAGDFREEQRRGNDLLAAELERVRETGLAERLSGLARSARTEGGEG
jgi:CHAD domain-containing protein